MAYVKRALVMLFIVLPLALLIAAWEAAKVLASIAHDSVVWVRDGRT